VIPLERKVWLILAAASAFCIVMGCAEVEPTAPSDAAPPGNAASDLGDAGGLIDDDESRAPEQELTVEILMASGVVLDDGYAPHPQLGQTDGVPNWPPPDATPEAIGDPPIPDGLGPLRIRATIERYPLSCIEYTRTIAEVDVGGSVGEQMIAEQIQQLAAAEHEIFQSWFSSEDDCTGIDSGLAGNKYQELSEEPCRLPSGPPLRCFLLADFGYPAGAAHTYLRHHQLVFEAESGRRLSLDDIFRAAQLDPVVATESAMSIVQVMTEHVIEPTIRQARPELDVLVFEFSPYEAGPFAAGTRQVAIPWAAF
jgi:hypothetical protein